MTFDDQWTVRKLRRRRECRLLEAVMSLFHGWLSGGHFFAASFFLLIRRRRGWFAFHLLAALVSVICFAAHKRDSREK